MSFHAEVVRLESIGGHTRNDMFFGILNFSYDLCMMRHLLESDLKPFGIMLGV